MRLFLDCSVSSNAESAERLALSVRTVESVIQAIYDKLGLKGKDRNRFYACCFYAVLSSDAKEQMMQNFAITDTEDSDGDTDIDITPPTSGAKENHQGG